MDKIFIAIGRFFKKIWEWIKTTAWVQPLLIVAVIFGIIFSINPIADAIKEAVEADDAGEFYEDHNVKYNALFEGLQNQSDKYYKDVQKGKKAITEESGRIMVIYLDSTSVNADLEDEIARFYENYEETCEFYIVDFGSEENSCSTWDKDEKEYTEDAGKTYYSHLLDQLFTSYNEDDGWRNYNETFRAKYGYDIFYPNFSNDEYVINSYEDENASSNIDLPVAVVYEKGEIADMRFGDWKYYKTNSSNASFSEVLSDMWVGA